MDFATYVLTMQNMLAIDSPTEPNFVQILPTMIAFAENKIQADLDLIATVTTDTVQLRSGQRTADIPGCIYIVNSVNLITPSATRPDSGARNALQRVSVEAINWMWPDATYAAVPEIYAILNDRTAIFAPTPDAGYRAEFYGIHQLETISADNPTNWISINLPEMLIAASMIFGTGYQRDFGAMSEDPRASLSWEVEYQSLLKSQTVQSFRAYARSSAWQPFTPAPLATPPRA